MKIVDLKNRICFLLRESSFDKEAEQIDDIINRIIDPKEVDKKKYIEKIISRCNIRWLGDYYIKNISYNSWVDLISKLEAEAKKYY